MTGLFDLLHLLGLQQVFFLDALDVVVYEWDGGVLDDRQERHEEARHQIDVDAFHVGDFWQWGVRWPDECHHCQHRGYSYSQIDPESIFFFLTWIQKTNLPKATRAGAAVRSSQKETHDKTTINVEGI